ncbi:MAG: propanediol/glycerol family dehydratase medium subunit [Synergistaceae bacterium]|jgi:propanediol dehydratase medium subunit|nr:propanediol/glycerol family dehydratase medium subunit [Synergistaceae bacterium]
MQINPELLEKIVTEVLAEMEAGARAGEVSSTVSASTVATSSVATSTVAEEPAGLLLQEKGAASRGSDPKEIVLAVTPAFGTTFKTTIVKIPHSAVLRQVFAGAEEEGLHVRAIRVYHTADVAFMAHHAARISGSGIGIGILSRGTAVIHQRDLNPLSNLELFPQSPVIDLPTFRAIGKNAAKYAKGETPTPVPTKNDPMARPRYQGLAALLHNKEAAFQERSKAPQELSVSFE